MNWKKQLAGLPLIMPNAVPSITQYLEGELDGTLYIVTHRYLLGAGPIFTFTFVGSNNKIWPVVLEIAEELGSAPKIVGKDGNTLFFVWPSGCKELPKPNAYQCLGRRVILSILSKWQVEDYELLMTKALITYDIIASPIARQQYVKENITSSLPRSTVETFFGALAEIRATHSKAHAMRIVQQKAATRN